MLFSRRIESAGSSTTKAEGPRTGITFGPPFFLSPFFFFFRFFFIVVPPAPAADFIMLMHSLRGGFVFQSPVFIFHFVVETPELCTLTYKARPGKLLNYRLV